MPFLWQLQLQLTVLSPDEPGLSVPGFGLGSGSFLSLPQSIHFPFLLQLCKSLEIFCVSLFPQLIQILSCIPSSSQVALFTRVQSEGYLCPVLGTVSCFVTVLLQVRHFLPWVRPSAVHVGETAFNISVLWLFLIILPVNFLYFGKKVKIILDFPESACYNLTVLNQGESSVAPGTISPDVIAA